MAQKIRQSDMIGGINVGRECYKLSLYAEDLMLYLTNTELSIPYIMKIIEQYSKISGYKMNIEKT